MKYKLNKGFIVQKVGGGSTIFDGEESELYTFNKTGSVIFEKIKLGWDKERIIVFLSESYSINKKTATKDVEDFIIELINSKVIREV